MSPLSSKKIIILATSSMGGRRVSVRNGKNYLSIRKMTALTVASIGKRRGEEKSEGHGGTGQRSCLLLCQFDFPSRCCPKSVSLFECNKIIPKRFIFTERTIDHRV